MTTNAERLADLTVGFAANVQPGQVVRVASEVGQIEMVRAVAQAAYRCGASFVDIDLDDPYVQRARVLHGSDDVLTHVPTWREARLRELDERHGANIKITGPTAPGLFDDLDPARVNRAQPPASRVWRGIEYRVNNTVVPGPTTVWARSVYPDVSPEAALEALWSDLVTACRLDEPDPVAAWRARFHTLGAIAEWLTGLELDAVRLSGPGTELTVGLPPSARWEHGATVSKRGVPFVWNLPTEEVYTTPNSGRVDGHARLSRPALVGGTYVDDVTLAFREGAVVDASGGDAAAPLREFVRRDPGTARLGELALVDADSRVSETGRTFGVILLDENAASHIALGFGFPELVDPVDRPLVNQSGDHLDLTIGSDSLQITGVQRNGAEVPLLVDGRWQR